MVYNTVLFNSILSIQFSKFIRNETLIYSNWICYVLYTSATEGGLENIWIYWFSTSNFTVHIQVVLAASPVQIFSLYQINNTRSYVIEFNLNFQERNSKNIGACLRHKEIGISIKNLKEYYFQFFNFFPLFSQNNLF